MIETSNRLLEGLVAKKEKTYEEKEIRRLKRSVYDLRRENKRLKNALKHNNLYIDGTGKVEKRGVQEPKKEVKSTQFDKQQFLTNIKEQRREDGTWDIHKDTLKSPKDE